MRKTQINAAQRFTIERNIDRCRLHTTCSLVRSKKMAMPTSWPQCNDKAEIYICGKTYHTQSMSLWMPFSHFFNDLKKRWKAYKFIKNYFHCTYAARSPQWSWRPGGCAQYYRQVHWVHCGVNKVEFPHFKIGKYVWQCDMAVNGHCCTPKIWESQTLFSISNHKRPTIIIFTLIDANERCENKLPTSTRTVARNVIESALSHHLHSLGLSPNWRQPSNFPKACIGPVYVLPSSSGRHPRKSCPLTGNRCTRRLDFVSKWHTWVVPNDHLHAYGTFASNETATNGEKKLPRLRKKGKSGAIVATVLRAMPSACRWSLLTCGDTHNKRDYSWRAARCIGNNRSYK